MDTLKKVERANELVKVIQNAEAELTALFGGETVKRKWQRRPPPEAPPQG